MPRTLPIGSIVGGLGVCSAAAIAVWFDLPPIPATAFPFVVAVVAWYGWDRPTELRAARREKGLCSRCGYDLRGNVSGVCPECGTARRTAATMLERPVNRGFGC